MEYYIQITGKTCMEKPLEKGKFYSVIFKELGVYGEDLRDGQGDEDKTTYRSKSLGEVIITDGKDIVISKQKKSSSQKLRARIWGYQNLQGIDSDDFYDKAMSKLILYFDEVWDLIKDK